MHLLPGVLTWHWEKAGQPQVSSSLPFTQSILSLAVLAAILEAVAESKLEVVKKEKALFGLLFKRERLVVAGRCGRSSSAVAAGMSGAGYFSSAVRNREPCGSRASPYPSELTLHPAKQSRVPELLHASPKQHYLLPYCSNACACGRLRWRS